MKKFRNVLYAERARADPVAIRPAFISKGAEKIREGVSPAAVLQLAGTAAGRESLRVKGYTREERLREEKKQQGYPEHDPCGCALDSAQDPNHFPLAPGGAPDEGEDAHQR